MNLPLVARYLGIVTLLIGGCMALSLPWAVPALGGSNHFEGAAVAALLGSMALALVCGAVLLFLGRHATGEMFRKEALAVVGLSWCLATLLGALPFLLSGTCMARAVPTRSTASKNATAPINEALGVRMTIVDAVFESASGFSGTGATVITDLEDAELVPRAILFWRSQTHFLGGLGIMVLFVAILGQGSTGKAIMRAELPGPRAESSHARMQHTAWAFTGIYLGLNILLTLLLLLFGVGVFDALCHSFGTIATGGFSTFNDSVAHFHSPLVEMTITLFMMVACVNFSLLYSVVILQPGRLFRDTEVRTYLAILAAGAVLVVAFGLGHGDFGDLPNAVRFGLFQVTSILTNTGFATHDFDTWNQFGRGLLFLLMFVGGCAGSTSCSIKVIRHVIFCKALGRELERAYRPSVVRPVRLDGETVERGTIEHVLFYFGLVVLILVVSWMGLIVLEPDAAWTAAGQSVQQKFVDCASAVGATLNGVGPGLGTVGATKNYAHFQPLSKLLLTLLMLLGRLEMIPILILFSPGFWKTR